MNRKWMINVILACSVLRIIKVFEGKKIFSWVFEVGEKKRMRSDALVEFTNALACYGVSFCVFVSLNLYKHFVTKASAKLAVPHFNQAKMLEAAENSISYKLAWTSTCLLVPLFSHLIFAEVYTMQGGIADSSLTILGLTWTFMLIMIVWIYAQWILMLSSRLLSGIFFLVVLGSYMALIVNVLGGLGTWSYDNLLVFVFFIPIVSAIDATRRSNNYRTYCRNHAQLPQASAATSSKLATPKSAFSFATVVDSDHE